MNEERLGGIPPSGSERQFKKNPTLPEAEEQMNSLPPLSSRGLDATVVFMNTLNQLLRGSIPNENPNSS
ncbi:MAG: hypothetical protein AAB553_06630 [Patescibacteria group bacterium]